MPLLHHILYVSFYLRECTNGLQQCVETSGSLVAIFHNNADIPGAMYYIYWQYWQSIGINILAEGVTLLYCCTAT